MAPLFSEKRQTKNYFQLPHLVVAQKKNKKQENDILDVFFNGFLLQRLNYVLLYKFTINTLFCMF
jgi:hypothetical protein